LSSDTLAVPFRMRDTVLGDTPASRATSSKVEGEVGPASLKGQSCRCFLKTFSL
jgi:hypothetical protein